MLVDAVPAVYRTLDADAPPGAAPVPARWHRTASERRLRARAAWPPSARRLVQGTRLGAAAGDYPAKRRGADATGTQPRRPGLHRRSRTPIAADQRQRLHRDAAGQVAEVHR